VFSYFPALERRLKLAAGLLSGGEQQMLAIGRALMTSPRLLLLDEPSIGLAPVLVREIFRIIRRFNEEEGLTILLVEQNASLALEMAHHGYVLETGTVSLDGSPASLRASAAVRTSYLGSR
jgi:branched-chain amino acid transport system ATP-binding protein